MSDKIPPLIAEICEAADVKIAGTRPWDFRIHNPNVFARVLYDGSLGLGEAYMDGWWDCDAIDDLLSRFLAVKADFSIANHLNPANLLYILQSKFTNMQSVRRAFQVGERHYDIGNDVFAATLDPRMIYSCGYWEYANSLAQAQKDKLHMICTKLELARGERLLDIGCGWGGLAAFAAEHYGVAVTGVTISREQKTLAETRCAGLPVDIQLTDYRSLTGSYDKVVSVGMFEHVGHKNYATFLKTVQRLVEPHGLFLLHTIGKTPPVSETDRWINKYIFPNGHIPTAGEIVNHLGDLMVIEDWHNFGHDYDLTLQGWRKNFNRAWPLLAEKYGPRFGRMMQYYLAASMANFRAGRGKLWQLVLTPVTRGRAYRSVRLQPS
jgi:cyclopropane-fatty-acyl-phospholipid synthase